MTSDVPRWQRLLLPGSLVPELGHRRSARDWAVDVTLFFAALVLGAAVLGETWSDHGTALVVVDLAVGGIALGSLWVRRSWPVPVAAITLAASAVSGFAAGAGVVALFNAAIRAPRRALVVLVALSIPVSLVFALLYPSSGSIVVQGLIGALITVVALGWGLFARAQRELVHSLHERATRLEAEAREAERRRIAREMHDVLAHRISLLSLHAGALEFRPDASPEEIAEAAGVIRTAAADALADLRDVIGVLREDVGDIAPPQPTLADVPALVEESRAAGVEVTLSVAVEDAPAALGRTAYRIVQEGLTNARRHAPGAPVVVSISGDAARGLVVEVVNRAPVPAASAGPWPAVGSDRPVVSGAARPSRATALEPRLVPGGGTGLIGLAERVELAGGALSHGAERDGFAVRATLPWRA